MNNQFATQFLLEDRSELDDKVSDTFQELGITDEHLIKMFTNAVLNGHITLEKAIEIIHNTKLDENGLGGGGSTTGGGTTAGASFAPGAGEQMATTKAFKPVRKSIKEGDGRMSSFEAIKHLRPLVAHTIKHNKILGTFEEVLEKVKRGDDDILDQMWELTNSSLDKHAINVLSKPRVSEDAPRLAGDPSKTNKQGSKNLNAYSSVGFTKAPSAEEAGKKIKGVQVKMLWKEGQTPTWDQIKQHVLMLAKQHSYGRDYINYMKAALEQGLIIKPEDLETTTAGYGEALREYINESRAYSQFKKQTAIRPKGEQMHEAVKAIHKKLEEVSKLLEFAQQMRTELSEGENALEYKHNTKKIFEKINSKVVEVYTKTRQLK